ncbi:MAG: ABC transporter ATP-binding protein, partial [Acidimicrobiaceae bacterium]|nr:ABC transporter ATP-binding protein [Acidimicrobiaceae bacterium]
IGPNGAGKTTAIEVCSGVRQATSGTVSVLGLDPQSNRLEMNSRIGVMLQDGGVYPSGRVGEVLEHYCNLFGNRERADDLLEAVDLGSKRKATWRKLSGGEKQRLSLALALAARPEVAFLDEPTSGVDIVGRDLIRGIVRNLADSGCAVILATHELDEAQRVADHVVMFQRGRLIANSSLEDLCGDNQAVTLRTSSKIDLAALAMHMNCRVDQNKTELRLYANSDANFISRLSNWFAENKFVLDDLRSGTPRLEDIYRELINVSEQSK